MANTLPIFAMTIATTEAITYTQAVAADGTVAAAGEAMVGLAQRDAESGVVTATVVGIENATAGGAIAQNAQVEVGADGKLVTLAAGVAVGMALEAAAADGDQISVLLK